MSAATDADRGGLDRPQVVRRVNDWFALNARDLPWRRSTPWGVLVSEFMLQQTPVARVLGPWAAWMERWPTPDALAGEPPGAAVAAWGRLGYPRRALRLHQAATAIATEHGGQVPDELDALLALPGVGRYTAAAIASFAFGGRAVVLDTNVRRVLARIEDGQQFPPASATAAEWRRGEQWLPDDDATAARWAASAMELGAVVCSARSPRCEQCPVADLCRWRTLGHPAHDGPPRKGQAWQGTDRQCRGVLLDLVRQQPDGVEVEALLEAWHDRGQAERSLAGLLADGLAHQAGPTVTL